MMELPANEHERVSRASGVGQRGPRPSTRARGVPSNVEGRERACEGSGDEVPGSILERATGIEPV